MTPRLSALRSKLDWIEQGLTSHSSDSTHLRHFGDGGVTATSARIVAAVRAQCVRDHCW